MKRSILVAAGTVAGVTAVVSYHATSATSDSSLTKPAAVATSSGTGTGTSSGSGTGTSPSPATTTSTTSSSSTTSSQTTTAARPRSALGQAIGFPYGDLQVKVTERKGRIVDVSIASFQINDSHSESIDQFAVPQLRQEVIAAQSAQIDGVSGASYTAQAYEQSVQSAIDKL